MAVDPIVKLQSTWKIRMAHATAAGVNPEHVRQIATQDYNSVKAGGKAMTRDAAWASLQALQSGGANPLAKQRPTGIVGTVENVVPDLASTLWNFPKGVVEAVHHAPSEATRALDELLKLPSQVGTEGPGGALRDVAASRSLLSMIPGVNTAAGLTTAKGRKGLQQHPIGTLLDVVPYVSEGVGAAARLANVGDVAGAAAEVAQADSAALAAGEKDIALSPKKKISSSNQRLKKM